MGRGQPGTAEARTFLEPFDATARCRPPVDPMLPDDESTTRVLLIEDSSSDAHLVREVLSTIKDPGYEVEWVETAAQGAKAIEEGEYDVVLLDLNLPDLHGMDEVAAFHKRLPDVPLVVLTGSYGLPDAPHVISAGAQDYLLKDEIDARSLARAIHYAILRHDLQQRRLEEARQVELEVGGLGTLHGGSLPSAVTSRSFGMAPLREYAPDVFQQYAEAYAKTLELALEERVFRVDHGISDQLRALGDQFGFLKATPRDVVEVHTAAVRDLLKRQPPEKSRAVLDEGRLRSLEVMGYLASYYRARHWGRDGEFRATSRDAPRPHPGGRPQ